MIDVVPVEDPAWAAFVAAHPDATCFHRPEWARLLMDCYGYSGSVVVDRDADGAVVAGMPVLQVRQLNGHRRWACLPFSDECGPLRARAASAARLVAAVDALRRGAKADHLEIRAAVAGVGGSAHPAGVIHSHTLDRDPDVVLRRFSGSARRSIRKAERAGVEIRHAREPADAETYYALHVRTRKRLGVPVQPRRYFRLLWERILAPGDGTLVLAEHAGTAVAGGVFLTGGSTVTYKYGASDPEHWPARPNHLMLWRAMSWGAERGYTTFDWGRSDAEDTGLRDFKASMGGRERALVYTRLPEGEPAGPGSLDHAMRRVLRRSPAWVGRAAGELLYRYVG